VEGILKLILGVNDISENNVIGVTSSLNQIIIQNFAVIPANTVIKVHFRAYIPYTIG
jgi:hypothetical protein